MAQSLQIKKLSPQHTAILERLALEPHINKGQLAAEVGISRTHLSVIINSDAFKAALGTRQKEISGPVIASLQEKLTALADSTLDALIEKVETVGGDMDEMRKVLDTALGGLGMKSPQGPAPGVNVSFNVNHIDQATLAQARETMKTIHAQRQATLEAPNDEQTGES